MPVRAKSAGYVEPRERLLRLFEDRIYNDNFKDLSGWDRPAEGIPCSSIRLKLEPKELRRYIFDRELTNELLSYAKDKIAAWLSLRESMPVHPGSILLTPGATAALAVILHTLRVLDVKVVITDPPFYFSVKKLCDALGLTFISIARSLDSLDGHDCIFEMLTRHRQVRKALILTHPRYVLSRNYPGAVLVEARRHLNSDDILIIDQSVDMEFCNQDNYIDFASNFIKIRTIGKALSLNGSRLAVVEANMDLLPDLNRQASILYGSLDAAMLKLGAMLVETPASFETRLRAVSDLVAQAFLETRMILGGSHFEAVRPENGFLGYLTVDTSKVGRFALYQALLRENVHSIFSAHLGLHQSYNREMIRVNYLLDIKPALRVLASIRNSHKVFA